MKKVLRFILLLSLFSVMLIKDSSAVIYKYVDKNGTVCFTDGLQAIPEEYREKAVLISGQSKKEKEVAQPLENKEGDSIFNPLTEKKDEPAGTKEKIKNIIKNLINSRAFKVTAGIIGFLFAFVIIGKMGNYTGNKMVGSILRIALTFFVLLYIFNSHLKEIGNTFAMLKQEVF